MATSMDSGSFQIQGNERDGGCRMTICAGERSTKRLGISAEMDNELWRSTCNRHSCFSPRLPQQCRFLTA